MYIYNLYSHVHILRNAKCHTRKSKHKKLNEQIVYEHTDAEVITVYILKHKHVPCTSSQKLFIDFEDTCTKCFHRVAIHKRDTCNRWAKYCTWCRLHAMQAARGAGCTWYRLHVMQAVRDAGCSWCRLFVMQAARDAVCSVMEAVHEAGYSWYRLYVQ